MNADLSSPLRSAFRQLRRELPARLRKTRQRASPAEVHQLRVCVRRLRVLTRLLGSAAPKHQAQEARRALRRLGKALGRVRELDVAMEDSRRFGMKAKSLRKRRMERAMDLRPQLRKKEGRHLLRLLEDWNGKASARKLRKPLRHLAEELRHLEKRPPRGRKELHELRILLKKCRYALESSGVRAKAAERLQGDLGKVHDLQVLERLVGSRRRLRKEQKAAEKRARRILQPALRSSRRKLENMLRWAA